MTVFLENVLQLLGKANISKNKLLTDLKLGKNSFVNWESRGTIPNGETLSKIADYFDVTVDYLLGTESKPSAAVTDEDLKFALFNGADGITDEMFEEVKWFARAVMEREQAKKANIEKTEYPVRAAARNGTPPSTGTITKAEADEIRNRPDADSDL